MKRIATFGKQLAQSRPANTTAVSIYSLATGYKSARIDSVHLANTSASSAVCYVYHDDDGTTYDETTCILEITVAANSSVVCAGPIYTDNTTGNIAFEQGTASAITVTLYGEEMT